MSVLISMLIGSRLSTRELVEKSILSIILNIGTDDFLLVIGISEYIGFDIVRFVEDIELKNANVTVITNHCSSAPEFHNHVFLEYGLASKWFIVVHDDIELETENLVGRLENSLKFSDNIGWISFTDNDYLHGHHAPPVRPGFHYDCLYENGWRRKKLFQFHLLEENYWKKGTGVSYFSNLNYDFPILPVKCHAPFCHLIAIESEKFRITGLWENWSVTSLLADEDQGLSALKEGLVNIWIPDIIYTHFRKLGATRSWPTVVKERKRVRELFAKKWGFGIPVSKDDVKKIKRMYGNTNIIWSFGRRSFEWDYLRRK